MATSKTDYKKVLKEFYNPKTVPQIVDVPQMQYLMIDGKSEIGGTEFQTAIEALFSVSYRLKFTIKKASGFDYSVMPLEGLWWADDMNDFTSGKKENWKWTLMIMQPDKVTSELFKNAVKDVEKKKPLDTLLKLRLENLSEGKSVQMMHLGPFSEEHPNIVKMHDLIHSTGGSFDGLKLKHHEIYLSDFRKTDPQKLKTVLRQPFIS